MSEDHVNMGDPLSGIHSLPLDLGASTALITMRNGYKELMHLQASASTMGSPIGRLEYFPSSNQVQLKTDRGELLVAEVPTYRQPAPRNGRPIVYLDQKDWSFVANVLYEPNRVQSSTVRDATNLLIEMARNKRVILPMSFGHLTETAQWTDSERRYRLALTLLELTGGWQMRHPVDVRQYELMQSLLAVTNAHLYRSSTYSRLNHVQLSRIRSFARLLHQWLDFPRKLLSRLMPVIALHPISGPYLTRKMCKWDRSPSG
jgi:hypothetical protein